MPLSVLPKQPPVYVSYLRVGRLLYYSLFLFVLESWVYWVQLRYALLYQSLFHIGFWIWSFMFSFVHIFLVLADGWSRFQNYKRAKDQFFIHGFNRKICDTYIGSKCQRMAALVAAEELGLEKQVAGYYQSKGVKWYHYVPYFMVKEPLFLFKKKFWNRTFLESNYVAKFDYHSLAMEVGA